MRTLIKGYTFTAGTRSIDCSNCNPFDIENIRLIVNETQKVVICSSMQKDLIISIIDGVITYAETLPVLSDDDKLTIEIDYSYNISSELMNKGLLTNGKSMMEILANGDFTIVPFQIDDNVIETISRQYAFYNMTNLTAVTMSNLKAITNTDAFKSCSNLTTVTFGKLTSFASGGTFTNCYKLSNIIIGVGTDINLDFSSMNNATWNSNIDASIWNQNFVSGIINNLFDFTSGTTHTIKCGTYPYAKLTPETKALATAKNWNITA